MKKAILVYNPLSGDRIIAGKLDYIIKRFQKEDILLQPYPLNKDSYKKIPDILNQNNYDFVVASGGDGTLSSVVNQLLHNGFDLPIGVIPSGTCNDFARCLNISPALEKNIDTILMQNIKNIDIGLIDDKKYFLNTCAGGLFADVSFNTDGELKKNIGPIAYYIKALSEVVNIRSFPLKITTENECVEEDIVVFMISNGKHAACFSNIFGDASMTDGVMDILLIKKCSPIDLAGLFFKVLNNELLNDPRVINLKAKECSFESKGNITVSIDGEEGVTLPKHIRFLPKFLKVFA